MTFIDRIILLASLAISTPLGIANAGPIVDAATKAEALADEGKSVEAVFAIDGAIAKLWDKIGMNIVEATFVSEKPTGYGAYQIKEKPVYKSGEDMIIYAEVVGFKYGKKDDKVTVDLNVDMEVKTKEGKSLGSQKDFLKLNRTSRIPAREFYSVITYTFDGIPTGNYTVFTKLNDQHDDQWAAFELDFTIVK